MTSCSCCSVKLTAKESKTLANFKKVMQKQKDAEGSLIPLLQTAQGMFGYLPAPALKAISLALGKPYSEVAGVAGFYSFFSMVPRGKHLVRVCLGTACYVRGGQKVLQAFKDLLGVDVGQTTPDRKYTLEIGRCFGACGLAPAVMIDEDIHQRVKAARVGTLLEKYSGGMKKGKGGK